MLEFRSYCKQVDPLAAAEKSWETQIKEDKTQSRGRIYMKQGEGFQ